MYTGTQIQRVEKGSGLDCGYFRRANACKRNQGLGWSYEYVSPHDPDFLFWLVVQYVFSGGVRSKKGCGEAGNTRHSFVCGNLFSVSGIHYSLCTAYPLLRGLYGVALRGSVTLSSLQEY